MRYLWNKQSNQLLRITEGLKSSPEGTAKLNFQNYEVLFLVFSFEFYLNASYLRQLSVSSLQHF